jgi:hypothetical protein
MGSRRAPFDEVVERVHVPDAVASPTDTLHRILIGIGEADAAWVAQRPGSVRTSVEVASATGGSSR